MKRTLLAIAAVSLISMTGCANQRYYKATGCGAGGCAPEPAACSSSASCDNGSCQYGADRGVYEGDPGACERDPWRWCGLGKLFHRKERMPRGGGESVEAYNPGPASGAVAYPYYTNRGPRDYLARELPSIGP